MIQRGTNHIWIAEGNETCVFLAIIIDAPDHGHPHP
jgi:hypothetical protein